jgi:hypothetical protein
MDENSKNSTLQKSSSSTLGASAASQIGSLNLGLREPSAQVSATHSTSSGVFSKTQRPAAKSEIQVRSNNTVAVSFAAIVFDTIVVLGLTCLFAVAVLLVTNVDFIGIITMARTDWMTALSLALLFISAMELYFIIFRSFMGSTLGEWAFDIELGTPEQQAAYTYPLKVIARSFIVMVTGLITLPILSFIFNKDITGAITGVSLRRGEMIG